MLSLQAKSTNKIVAGISIFENGIALAIIDHSTIKPSLKHAYFYACSGTEQVSVLSKLSKEHKLYSIACNLVLYSHDYQIHQIDAPDVPKHELSAALKWQIKDLIDFHIDDAVIDKIELPNQNAPIHGGKHSILVIACRQSLIQNYVDLLHTANCNLTAIDIAALASRNIVSYVASTEQSSVGLLNLWDDRAKISVFLNHDLYINRSSSIGIQSLAFVSEDNVDSQSILDSLTLELQRTFDYYESHARQAAISHLYILSNGQLLANIPSLIEERLGITCSIIEPSDFVSCPDSIDTTVMNNCMMAMGGALRMEY
ncbi:MAG: pilus assembly protein PilM [Gammaproteobacteria bacterium]|nr:pilus assembly protein PilM [Gammaproteobacteria bacterium]